MPLCSTTYRNQAFPIFSSDFSWQACAQPAQCGYGLAEHLPQTRVSRIFTTARLERAASLDDPSGFEPLADIWTGSAQPWDYMNPDSPKYERELLEEDIPTKFDRHKSSPLRYRDYVTG